MPDLTQMKCQRREHEKTGISKACVPGMIVYLLQFAMHM